MRSGLRLARSQPRRYRRRRRICNRLEIILANAFMENREPTENANSMSLLIVTIGSSYVTVAVLAVNKQSSSPLLFSGEEGAVHTPSPQGGGRRRSISNFPLFKGDSRGYRAKMFTLFVEGSLSLVSPPPLSPSTNNSLAYACIACGNYHRM